jgi:hypothetical protein
MAARLQDLAEEWFSTAMVNPYRTHKAGSSTAQGAMSHKVAGRGMSTTTRSLTTAHTRLDLVMVSVNQTDPHDESIG